jgi:hypothetical protein
VFLRKTLVGYNFCDEKVVSRYIVCVFCDFISAINLRNRLISGLLFNDFLRSKKITRAFNPVGCTARCVPLLLRIKVVNALFRCRLWFPLSEGLNSLCRGRNSH